MEQRGLMEGEERGSGGWQWLWLPLVLILPASPRSYHLTLKSQTPRAVCCRPREHSGPGRCDCFPNGLDAAET